MCLLLGSGEERCQRSIILILIIHAVQSSYSLSMHIAAAVAPRRPAPELSIDQMVTFTVLRPSVTISLLNWIIIVSRNSNKHFYPATPPPLKYVSLFDDLNVQRKMFQAAGLTGE